MVTFEEVKHLCVTYFGCILIIIGVATPKWKLFYRIAVFAKIPSSAGLFQQCEEGTCIELKDKYVEIKVTFILVMSGTIAGLICVGAMTIYFIKRNEPLEKKATLSCVALITSFIGAILIVIGCLVYAYKHFNAFVTPGFSFYSTFFGSLLLSIGGSLFTRHDN